MPGEQIKRSTDIQATGERVALRPLRRDELTKMEPLFEGSAPAGAGHLLAIVLRAVPAGRQGQEEPIGAIHYRAGSPGPGWLTIGRVVVATGLRAHGQGAEAVRLLESEAQRLGLAQRFLATVGLDDGLGLYFWLRLGYRPARPGEAGWPAGASRDIIAMVRTMDDSSRARRGI